MDYLREINLFYDWLETNGLSHPARHLWHVLMHIANRARWQVPFAVAMSTLEVKTGMNKKAIERARNELSQVGRIRWRSRGGNQSAEYQIVSLVGQFAGQNIVQNVAQGNHCECVGQNEAQNVAQSVAQPVPQSVSQPVPQPVPINIRILRQDDTKTIQEPEAVITRANEYGDNEAIRLRLNLSRIEEETQGIGLPMGTTQIQYLELLHADYGLDWVLEAINRAGRAPKEKISLRYVEGILRNWRTMGGIDDDRGKTNRANQRAADGGESTRSNEYDQFGGSITRL